MLGLDQAREIKEELEALDYADFKAKFVELGIESVFKAGVKKSVLIQSAIKALEDMPEISENEILEDEIDSKELKNSEEEELDLKDTQGSINEIETDFEEVDLDSEKVDLEEDLDSEESILDLDPEIDLENDLEENETLETVEKKVEIEEIDENLYTEEEILENIELVECNMRQAIPTTRNFLLRKLDALQKALARKQAK